VNGAITLAPEAGFSMVNWMVPAEARSGEHPASNSAALTRTTALFIAASSTGDSGNTGTGSRRDSPTSLEIPNGGWFVFLVWG
jgi:hypothetical protein